MTPVNNRAVAHHPVHQEAMPTDRRSEEGMQARAPSDQGSAPARPRATTEDRRSFSPHKAIINSPSPNAGPSALAALTQSNDELRTGIKHLSEQASIEIGKLQQELISLGQQFHAAGPSGNEDAASARSKGERAGSHSTEQMAAQPTQPSPERSLSAAGRQAPEGAAPHTIEQVVSDQASIGQQLVSLREDFNNAFEKLQKTIMELMQKISGGAATQSPSSASTPSNTSAQSRSAQPPEPVNTPDASQAQTSSGSQDIEALAQENNKLRAETQQLYEGVTNAVSTLKQQIAELKQQLVGKEA